jgi:hypothetical protein
MKREAQTITAKHTAAATAATERRDDMSTE